MELRDGDLMLRPWVEDDADVLVVGCNDPEIARWIPTIPNPYTREDAFAFIRSEVRSEHRAFAIELGGRVVGASEWVRIRMLIARRWVTGSRPLQGATAPARVPFDCSLGMRSRNSGFSASIS